MRKWLGISEIENIRGVFFVLILILSINSVLNLDLSPQHDDNSSLYLKPLRKETNNTDLAQPKIHFSQGEEVSDSPTILIYSTDSTGSYYRDKFDNETKIMLENLGFNVTVEDRSTIPVLNSSHFVNISQFWIMNGGDGLTFTVSEQDLILSCWRNGTDLVLAGDQTGWYTNVNLIGNEFGVEYEGAYLFSNPQTPTLVSHPIWINVSTLYSDPTLPQLVIDIMSEAQSLSIDSGYNQHALFENETGSVFWGSSFGNFMNVHVTKYNNSEYISNLARYLQQPEMSLVGGENNSFLEISSDIALRIIDDNLRKVELNWNGGINQSISSPFSIPLPATGGWNILNIYVEDNWNHTIHDTYNFSILQEQIILQDSFEDLDIWEITNPSIMTLNSSFGNSAPSVEINSTQSDLGLCQYEEVFFPVLESEEFIRTSIDVYIPEIQTGSISIFTDITGTKFPFQLRIHDTNSVRLRIYSTGQDSIPSYSFISNKWYTFTVDIYIDHITLAINGTQLTSISSSFYQSKWVPIAFGDGAQSSPEQGHYLFDNIKVSAFTKDFDITAPIISITNPINRDYYGNSVWLNFSINEPTLWIGYSLDGETNVTLVSENTLLEGLYSVTHTLQVFANDTAGNMGKTEVIAFVVIPQQTLIGWNQTYSSSDYLELYAMIQTVEGGFALAGSIEYSSTMDNDMWLGRTDANGVLVWNRTYGGTDHDRARAIVQTSEGGFALAGQTRSYGADTQTWLVNTDINGNLVWNRTYLNYNGSGSSFANAIVQTQDGGFVLAGGIWFRDTGQSDAFLLKTDSMGNLEWNQTFGGINSDSVLSMISTSDGGFVFAGYTHSFGAVKEDVWLVKTDANGTLEWNRTYGSDDEEVARAIIQTTDGGFALTGYIDYSGPDADMLLMKLNSIGILEWNQTYGGVETDTGWALLQTTDGGFALAGHTFSYGVSAPSSCGMYLVKTNTYGDIQWNVTYNIDFFTIAKAIVQTSDGEFVLGGRNEGKAILVKTDRPNKLPSLISINPGNHSIVNSDIVINFNISNTFGGLHYIWYNWDGQTNLTVDNLEYWNSSEYLFDDVTVPITEGWHNITLYINNTFGYMISSWFQVYVDITLPNIALSNLENNTILHSDFLIQFNVTDSHLDSIWCNWDENENVSINNFQDLLVPSTEGFHWLDIYANDSVGHIVSKSFYWWINLFPTINLHGSSNVSVQAYGTEIEVLINDSNLHTAVYNWDNGNNQSFTIFWNTSMILIDGWHWLSIYANDTYGASTKSQYQFYCDAISPSIDLDGKMNNSVIMRTDNIDLNIFDSWLDEVWFSWDSEDTRLLSGSLNGSSLISEGYHWLNIYANDTVGYQTSKHFRFFVNFLPEIFIKSLNNDSVIFANCDIEFLISDPSLTDVWYHWDLQPNVSLTFPFLTKAVNTRGNHKLFISARDSWNATTTLMFSFYVIGSVSTEEVTELPSITYSGNTFVYSFKLTNEETISLNLTLIAFGLNDDILDGNNSHIFLNPGEEITIELVIRPKHASIHQLEVFLFFNEEIYHQFSLDFNVNPAWMSPTFYLPFVIFPIILFCLLILIGSVSFYFYKSSKRFHQIVAQKLTPERKDISLSEVKESSKIPEFILRMGIKSDRNLILTPDGRIIDEKHQVQYIEKQIMIKKTPINLMNMAQEIKCSFTLIKSIVNTTIRKNKIHGFLHRDIFYPSAFISSLTTALKKQQTRKITEFLAEHKLNKSILEIIVKEIVKTDKTIFTIYHNFDEDKLVILSREVWKKILKNQSTSNGFVIGQILPDLTASNWQNIFTQQKLAIFQYNDRFFDTSGLQEYTVAHMDEISRIIHYVRHQLPYLPLSISQRREILQTFEHLLPVEPVHLPYFCQMDSAMIVKEQFAYVCMDCKRMICSSCFKEMKQTGMENCIHCGGNLNQHPAIQLEMDITLVDQMKGHEFENFLEGLFRTQGYQVVNIQSSGDHGVDLVVVKGEVRTGVQAKRFKPTNKIGNNVLIKLKGGGYFHDCQKLLVVTTSYYTSKAKEYAKGVGIELWDRNTLKNYLSQYNKHLGEK